MGIRRDKIIHEKNAMVPSGGLEVLVVDGHGVGREVVVRGDAAKVGHVEHA